MIGGLKLIIAIILLYIISYAIAVKYRPLGIILGSFLLFLILFTIFIIFLAIFYAIKKKPEVEEGEYNMDRIRGKEEFQRNG